MEGVCVCNLIWLCGLPPSAIWKGGAYEQVGFKSCGAGFTS